MNCMLKMSVTPLGQQSTDLMVLVVISHLHHVHVEEKSIITTSAPILKKIQIGERAPKKKKLTVYQSVSSAIVSSVTQLLYLPVGN